MGKAILVAAVGFVGTMMIHAIAYPTTPESARAAICQSPDTSIEFRNAQADAYSIAKNAVRQNLKAPASATFPDFDSTAVTVRRLNDCTFTVRAYVDSQNGFGAMIRTEFAVDVQFERFDANGYHWNTGNLGFWDD